MCEPRHRSTARALLVEVILALGIQVFHALQQEGIGVNVHYLPVHLHPYYKSIGFEEGCCPKAEVHRPHSLHVALVCGRELHVCMVSLVLVMAVLAGTLQRDHHTASVPMYD